MEREFRRTADVRNTSLKLDTYCTSPNLALMLEVKVLVDRPSARGVADDFDRLTEEVAVQQSLLHHGPRPSTTHGVIVVETWKTVAREWWNGRDPTNTFPETATMRLQSARDAGWFFGECLVGEFFHGSGAVAAGRNCYWLYAITPPFPDQPKCDVVSG